ncbi:hypothetical protein PtB15_4B651 [Puccinia triticina]|nr:hypothetical protein PtB15_4B651 [Puccinia triticina]
MSALLNALKTLDRGISQRNRTGSPQEAPDPHLNRHNIADERDEDFDETDSEDKIPFTLDNFEARLDSWNISFLRQVLTKRKKNSNRIPPQVQELLNFHKTKYIKIKLILTILGKVSEKTVNSWL